MLTYSSWNSVNVVSTQVESVWQSGRNMNTQKSIVRHIWDFIGLCQLTTRVRDTLNGGYLLKKSAAADRG